MRVTFLSPPLGMSGGTKVIAIYSDALQSMGHQVCIVAPSPAKIPIGAKLRSIAEGRGWPRPTLSTHVGKNLDVRTLDSARPIVESDLPDADVVIATWWETAEWAHRLPARKGAKVYFIQHHEIFSHLPARSRETYRLPFKKIVVAKWLQDLMANEYGDRNADLVLNSVDRSEFYAPERGKQVQPTVGLLYSTVNFKGLDISLEALSRVQHNHPNLNILSFGAEKPTPELSLPQNATFHYCPSIKTIRDIYSSCDVWLTASRSEGFNLPALEAMACRTPVVSTPTGWPADGVVDGMNGRLATDAASLADAVNWVLERDQIEWRSLSEAAYQTNASPSWKHSAQLFERSLLSTLS